MNKPICKLAQAYLDKTSLLCIPWRRKKSQPRACIDSRMLSTAVASPCQTLRELLRETTSKRIIRPSPSISGIALTQFAEGLHFSAFHCTCMSRHSWLCIKEWNNWRLISAGIYIIYNSRGLAGFLVLKGIWQYVRAKWETATENFILAPGPIYIY